MDDVPTIGQESGSESVPANPGVRLLPALALMAGVGALWLVGGGGTLGQADTSFPELPSSTTLAPLVEPSMIVDETLEWSSTIGLADLTRIDALADLPGPAAIVAGIDPAGVSVYRTDDGRIWERTFTLAAGPTASTRAVATTIEGTVLVAVNDPSPFAEGGAPSLWHSPDGITWSGDPLPQPGARRDGAVVSIRNLGEDILATGYLFPPLDLVALVRGFPAEVSELVRTGRALASVEDDNVTVRMWPGLVMYTRPLEAGDVSRDRAEVPSAISWRGDDPGRLNVVPRSDSTVVNGSLPARPLAAERGNGLALSADDVIWDEKLSGTGPSVSAAWDDGLVGISPGGDEIVARGPGTDDAKTLGSTVTLGGGPIRSIVASEAGIGAVIGGDYILPESNVIPLWTEGTFDWFLTTSTLIIHGPGRAAASASLYELEPLLESGELVIEVGDDRLEMPVDGWLEAAAQLNFESGLGHSLVAHSPDGASWSLQSWLDISGVDASRPQLFAADDFLLAVDQRSSAGTVGAWVGRPVP